MKTPLCTMGLVFGLLATTLSAQGAPAPYFENFDALTPATSLSCSNTGEGTLPAGWSTDLGTNNAFRVDSGGTSSSSTGPAVDNTTGTSSGQYLYTETSCSTGSWIATLNVAPIDTTTLATPTCEFAYHMYGAAMGTLELQEFDGVNWNTIWTLSGDQGDQWFRAAANLSSSPNLMLRFVGTRGTSFTSDMAIDDFFVGNPTPRSWELNDAAASFDISGSANGDAFAPVPTVLSVSQFACQTVNPVPGTFNLSCNVPNSAFELGYTPVLPVAAGSGAVVTPGGQFINLDFANISFVNGGAVPSLRAAPGAALPGSNGFSLSVPFNLTPPTTIAMQAVCIDPAQVDGFSASAAATIDASLTPAPTNIPLALTDDSFASVDLQANCVVGAGGLPFAGGSYTVMDVCSNGRVMFGGGDTDLSPSIADALIDNPFVGFWTDLNPSAGGSVDINIPVPGTIDVVYNNVPYFGTTIPVSFTVSFDVASGVVTMTGLNTIMANTGLVTGGDSQLLGISPGAVNSVTDGGATAFNPTGGGAPVGLADMTYDFNDPGVSGVGLPTSMGVNMISTLILIPVGSGSPAYAWNAL